MSRKFWLVLAALMAVSVFVFVAGCADDSEDSTNGSATITLTAPAAGDNWVAGTVHNIAWTDDNVDAFSIEYSTNNGTDWHSIATNVAANTYAWTVPNAPATTCKIRVFKTTDDAIYDESGVFTISLPPLVAVWHGTAATVAPMGLDSLRFNFGFDSTFIERMKAGSTEIIKSGTYLAATDTIHCHTTVSDGQPVDITTHSWYALTQNGTRLQMEVVAEGSQGQDSTYLVTFTKQ